MLCFSCLYVCRLLVGLCFDCCWFVVVGRPFACTLYVLCIVSLFVFVGVLWLSVVCLCARFLFI